MMHELDRIEQALASKPLNHNLFERCAVDMLSEIYPGLSPIPGGTDWGRDADIHTGSEDQPRLLVTASKTLDGVRKNMRSGIASLKKHNVPVKQIVLANAASLSNLNRESLKSSAAKQGVILGDDIYGREFFASKLRRDGEWRSRLLELSASPITLSRVPADIAESPWQLPLVGRDDELATLRATTGDMVVYGPPGVGKTRLLAAVPEVYFVDLDADPGRLAEDTRWLQPTTLVVDDAGRSKQLLGLLTSLRRTEPDVATYRVIAVCWPDEVDQLAVWLSGATQLQLELLERADLDGLLVAMKVTGRLARSEILRQAEGRVGWAMALANILRRTGDASSLLNGKALLGQVQQYLLRATVSHEASDVLATVAALGDVSESELSRLAIGLGMARPVVTKLLTGAAKSGLVDVASTYDWVARRDLRRYSVRPPMLADALVAERAFVNDVPGIDLESLIGQWPDKIQAITESAIDSALLGAPGARPVAQKLYRQLVRPDSGSDEFWGALSDRFARIHHDAAAEVLEYAKLAFDFRRNAAAEEPWIIEPIVNTSYLISHWYMIPEAVTLLLDAALVDQRNPNLNHPLRKLRDLVCQFHPEFPPPRQQRDLVAKVAENWITTGEQTPTRWTVYRHVIEAVLTLNRTSTLSAPGDPRILHLMETVAGDDEISHIYNDLWPPIINRLRKAPADVVKMAISAAEDWLRIGRGYDRPIGQDSPQSSTSAAKAYGGRIVRDLVPLVEGNPGLTASLRSLCEQFDLPVEVAEDPDFAVFLTDLDLRNDAQASLQGLEEAIGERMRVWAAEGDAETVINRLLDLREQERLSPARWPDRTQMAISSLAPQVDDPLAWADLALERGLFPQAAPMLKRAVSEGAALGEVRLAQYLTTPAARWSVIEAVFASASQSRVADRKTAMARLEPSDFRVLETMLLRQEIAEPVTKELLTETSSGVRGAVAAAMFARTRVQDDAPFGALEGSWLEALDHLNFEALPGFERYEADEFTKFLADRYPAQLVQFVASRLEAAMATQSSTHRVLSRSSFAELRNLPSEYKDQLWSRFSERSDVRFQLADCLVGDDMEWLEHALDGGLMTVDEAMGSYNPFHAHPPIEDMARLLGPRGVEPRRIAALAVNGSWSGEDSERYQALIDRFQAMAAAEDSAVTAVGRTGVEIFTISRDNALIRERRARVRGEL